MTEMTPVAELIQAVEQADSADDLLDAVEALSERRDRAAIPTLISVLGYNNPGAAVAAVEGLIDIGEPVIPILLAQLDGYNYGARAWALRVFAGIGDPRALDLLLKAASSDFSLSVRRAAARGLGIVRWSQLPPERRLTAQTQTLETLILACQDDEWVVRYAAVVGLQALAVQVPAFQERILAQLQSMLEVEAEIAIQGRVQFALQQLRDSKHLSAV